MKSTFTILTFSLLLFHSCQETPSLPETKMAFLTGKIDPSLEALTVDKLAITIKEDGTFSYETSLVYPTLINVDINGNEFEIYLHPGKTVQLNLDQDSIFYLGDLAAENNYLQKDKLFSEQLSDYFNSNWYSLHKKEEKAFIAIMDSIRGVFKTAMDQEQLNSDFVNLNTAALNYGLDRIILRYPEAHFYFTGDPIELSDETLANLPSEIDQVQFKHLSSYSKYTRVWLNQKINKTLNNPDTSISYLGAVKLNKALEVIQETFSSKELQEYWSFEMVKTHIEEYTWINGKDYLEKLRVDCSEPTFCAEIEAYEQSLLAKREGHDILVYKSVKGRQMEAHIFKPVDFDPNKKYAALGAFHGGGWAGGDASWTFGSARRAADWGMVGIAVEYRLSNRSDVTPLEAVIDAQDFMVWLRNQAEELSIDPQKIVLKGISAGGHLVNAVSVIPAFQVENSQPNALILLSPAIDTKDTYFKSLVRDTTHTTLLAPLLNLSTAVAAPTTLILQGRTDRLTPTTFVEAYKNKMDVLGYPCEVSYYEDCGHIFTPSHLDDTGTPQPDPVIMEQSYQRQKLFLTDLGYIQL